MTTETTDARVPSPADWRGFSVAADGVTRRYLLPRGLLRGAAAERVIEAGAALPLAGGAIAFCFAEAADRKPGAAGIRTPLWLGELAGPDRGLLDGLTAARPRWAGFDLAKPLIMGVVNVTPDSFSDGGDFASAADAIAQGIRLAEQGADIIDIGGESTRPGAAAVSAEEEIRRTVPVVRALAERGLCVSIDTRHAAVMEAAVGAGARIINDITALTGDPASAETAVRSGAAIVLMHMQGEPRTMQADPHYVDTTLDLLDYFTDRLAALGKLGVDPARIALDPGIGFGKKDPHNLLLLQELAAFQVFGCPVLLGVSRKSFIGRLSRKEPPKDRLAGSLAAGLAGFDQGVQILRVHDVAETYQARAIWLAVGR
ncbi:dihydropteroate synthase [Dongia sedimenti]|uniref:dihydropteroate synthase n=1 Tax=Dongia sedimenti TaxID=3064282 RepID=A0ABU0YFM5_9PROT|nr:dihydropteroate synthase [Rhodospirillaceae bacterium R-7]